MAEMSLISIPHATESGEVPSTMTRPPPNTAPTPTPTPTNLRSLVVDKTLGTTANLVKLLPCATVIAFQALSPSFSNHGNCYDSNKSLTGLLTALCTLSCCFFSFTDSYIGVDGRHYFGIATFKGFYVFNYDHGEEGERNMKLSELRKMRLRFVDFIHAIFSSLVFLALAMSDSDVQNCFFRQGGADTKELLGNLPLGIGLMSSLIFMIFPTSRKGIGHSDSHPTH